MSQCTPNQHNNKNLGVVVHSCNPSTQEAKAGELQVKDQNGLQSETLSQENPKITTKTLEKVLRIHFFLSVYVCVWYWGLSHSTSPFM
jgi:hypothetical protein